MAEESTRPPVRLMNFVSEEQLDEAKRRRGERVEDGTAQRDRPLYEILKENKDKKDPKFNERFKHRPPKALDDDETEFLDKLELAAVAVQSMIVHELKETPPVPVVQEQKAAGKKNPPARPIGMIIKVKPQAKKARLDQGGVEDSSKTKKTVDINTEETSHTGRSSDVVKTGLVSYSDGSDEDD